MTNGKTIDHAKRTLYSKQPAQDEFGQQIQYGNHSKKGDNWIGGPTQNLKAQYMPGYQGFVPSIKAENLFGKSFAKGTGAAVNKEFNSGFNHPNHARYMSQNAIEHGKTNFRRIRDVDEPADVNDASHTMNFSDVEFQGLEISKPNIYNDIPTIGYQGFKSSYRPETVRINHRKDPFFNMNALRPRIKELNMDEAAVSQTEGKAPTESIMKRATHQRNATVGQTPKEIGKLTGYAGTTVTSPASSPLRVPIAGYTGHRMGYRSQNFYGKNYRDCSIQSKILQQMALNQ